MASANEQTLLLYTELARYVALHGQSKLNLIIVSVQSLVLQHFGHASILGHLSMCSQYLLNPNLLHSVQALILLPSLVEFKQIHSKHPTHPAV